MKNPLLLLLVSGALTMTHLGVVVFSDKQPASTSGSSYRFFGSGNSSGGGGGFGGFSGGHK